jgi:hypothetical protein
MRQFKDWSGPTSDQRDRAAEKLTIIIEDQAVA